MQVAQNAINASLQTANTQTITNASVSFISQNISITHVPLPLKQSFDPTKEAFLVSSIEALSGVKQTVGPSMEAVLESPKQALSEVKQLCTEAVSGVKQCVRSCTEAAKTGSGFKQFLAKVGSKLKGISINTKIIGVFAIVLIFAGGVYLYRRNKLGGNVIEQRNARLPSNQQQLQQQVQHPNQINNIPPIGLFQNLVPQKGQWHMIQMSLQDFNQLRKIASQTSLTKLVQGNICPITQQVMKQPCQMTCCMNKLEKLDRWAEQAVLENEINVHARCILCFSPATIESIVFDEEKYTLITGIRQRICKTYRELNAELQRQWKVLIDGYFGTGYIDHYLGRIIN